MLTKEKLHNSRPQVCSWGCCDVGPENTNPFVGSDVPAVLQHLLCVHALIPLAQLQHSASRRRVVSCCEMHVLGAASGHGWSLNANISPALRAALGNLPTKSLIRTKEMCRCHWGSSSPTDVQKLCSHSLEGPCSKC